MQVASHEQPASDFPPPGNSSLYPKKKYSNDLGLRLYVNAAAAYPPSSGFGRIALYSGDVVKLSWQNDPSDYHRQWRCQPCRQTVGRNQTHEDFDWTACQYAENEVPEAWMVNFDVTDDSTHETEYKLNTGSEISQWMHAAVCVFNQNGSGKNGKFYFTAAFPYINTPPPSGRAKQLFSVDAPKGVPYCPGQGQDRNGVYLSPKTLFMIGAFGLLVCMMFVGYRYRQGKKKANAAKALSVYLENERQEKREILAKYRD